MDRYSVLKIVGEGSYGKALLCERKADKRKCIIKEISLKKMSKKEAKQTEQEGTILSKLHHPNITSFWETAVTPNNFYIVMEYCDGGDLADFMKKRRGRYLLENQVLHLFVQISLAIKHVHDRKILHRDLKAQNIFLTSAGIVKLGDFGIARVLHATGELAATRIGTPYYMSPEVMDNKKYNNKTDIWSLGCILYELMALKVPFDGQNMRMLIYAIMNTQPSPLPSGFSTDIKSLCSEMLRKDPRQRPSINTVLAKPVIRQRISSILNPDEVRDEFSHTVLHGLDILRSQCVKHDSRSATPVSVDNDKVLAGKAPAPNVQRVPIKAVIEQQKPVLPIPVERKPTPAPIMPPVPPPVDRKPSAALIANPVIPVLPMDRKPAPVIANPIYPPVPVVDKKVVPVLNIAKAKEAPEIPMYPPSRRVSEPSAGRVAGIISKPEGYGKQRVEPKVAVNPNEGKKADKVIIYNAKLPPSMFQWEQIPRKPAVEKEKPVLSVAEPPAVQGRGIPVARPSSAVCGKVSPAVEPNRPKSAAGKVSPAVEVVRPKSAAGKISPALERSPSAGALVREYDRPWKQPKRKTPARKPEPVDKPQIVKAVKRPEVKSAAEKPKWVGVLDVVDNYSCSESSSDEESTLRAMNMPVPPVENPAIAPSPKPVLPPKPPLAQKSPVVESSAPKISVPMSVPTSAVPSPVPSSINTPSSGGRVVAASKEWFNDLSNQMLNIKNNVKQLGAYSPKVGAPFDFIETPSQGTPSNQPIQSASPVKAAIVPEISVPSKVSTPKVSHSVESIPKSAEPSSKPIVSKSVDRLPNSNRRAELKEHIRKQREAISSLQSTSLKSSSSSKKSPKPKKIAGKNPDKQQNPSPVLSPPEPQLSRKEKREHDSRKLKEVMKAKRLELKSQVSSGSVDSNDLFDENNNKQIVSIPCNESWNNFEEEIVQMELAGTLINGCSLQEDLECETEKEEFKKTVELDTTIEDDIENPVVDFAAANEYEEMLKEMNTVLDLSNIPSATTHTDAELSDDEFFEESDDSESEHNVSSTWEIELPNHAVDGDSHLNSTLFAHMVSTNIPPAYSTVAPTGHWEVPMKSAVLELSGISEGSNDLISGDISPNNPTDYLTRTTAGIDLQSQLQSDALQEDSMEDSQCLRAKLLNIFGQTRFDEAYKLLSNLDENEDDERVLSRIEDILGSEGLLYLDHWFKLVSLETCAEDVM